MIGTHVLLEAAKAVSLKRFIHVSTDEVYGEVIDEVNHLARYKYTYTVLDI